MSDNHMQRRIHFLNDLLTELKELSDQLTKISFHIEEFSGQYYEDIFDKDKVNIQHEVDKYEANIQKTARLNYEIVEDINLWYDFSKDPREMKSIFFPLKFYLNLRKLKKRMKEVNKEKGRVTLENRFIKEKLTEWEYEIGQKALRQIEEGEQYQEYLLLIQRKSDLISDIEYLISTLPLSYPVKLGIKETDSFMNDLKTISDAS